jgi:methyl-accepting chemotaxis protein
MLLPFFLVSFSSLAGISYYLSNQLLVQSVDEEAKSIGNDYANQIQGDVRERVIHLEELATTPYIQAASDKDKIVQVLDEAKKRTGKFDNLFFIWLDGKGVRADGSASQNRERDYFKQVIETQKTYIAEPAIAQSTGKISVLMSVPVFNNGKLVGILGCSYTLEKFTEMVKKLKFKDTGYGFVVDGSGLTLTYPENPQFIGKLKLNEKKVSPELKVQKTELDDRLINLFKATVESGKQITGKYVFVDGVTEMAVFTPINLPGDRRWIMVVAAPEVEVIQSVNTLARTMLAVSLVFIIIAVIFIVILSKHFAKPIQHIRDACMLLAQGDFREREGEVHSKDEIGQLAQGFRTMRSSLRFLVTKVQGQAEQVAAASEELTASAEQSAQAATQVAISITDVAKCAEEQRSESDDASVVVRQMSENMEQIAVTINGVAEQSAQTAVKANEGNESVDKAVSQMAQIEQTVNTSAKVIAELGERSKEIGQIVDTISGIAGQTNLLALNAAIEAARAGEQGRGFAVVAEEVRKLAEQSQEAAKQIAVLIGRIQGDTNKAVAAMTDGTREVKLGAEVVNASGQAFREIVTLTNRVSDQVKEISSAIEKMGAGSQQIVGTVQRIDDLSKNTVGEAQTVSAATEEQSASMEEIASSSQALAELAQELQEVVSNFKV